MSSYAAVLYESDPVLESYVSIATIINMFQLIKEHILIKRLNVPTVIHDCM